MASYYLIKDLLPIGVDVDADGIITSYYRLPSPLLWVFRFPHPDNKDQHTVIENIITKVAVELIRGTADEQSIALVAALDENDEPDINGVVSIEGVTTYEGVLIKLGFTPSLSTN